jgi:hypothetical protein
LKDARIGSTRIPHLGNKVAVSLINQLEPQKHRDKKLSKQFNRLEKTMEESK